MWKVETTNTSLQLIISTLISNKHRSAILDKNKIPSRIKLVVKKHLSCAKVNQDCGLVLDHSTKPMDKIIYSLKGKIEYLSKS